MSNIAVFRISDSSELSKLDDKLSKTYKNNNKVRFVFDLTDLDFQSVGNIGKVLDLVKKFKNEEHKLESIEIVCPKSHKMKREIIKRCVKSAKIRKPVYIIDKIK